MSRRSRWVAVRANRAAGRLKSKVVTRCTRSMCRMGRRLEVAEPQLMHVAGVTSSAWPHGFPPTHLTQGTTLASSAPLAAPAATPAAGRCTACAHFEPRRPHPPPSSACKDLLRLPAPVV